jgi:lipopolysaccharide biosynthesis glycosyltransferase
LATISPVRNWRSLGLNPQSPYFNSGVMLIDLASWRRERLADQFLRCLAENERYVWCWDQYALNVVLADRWCILPLRWNVGAHTFEYPTTREIPVGSIDYQEMINDPAIVHFTTEFKPWRPGARHPQRDLYFAALDETAWCGWRPASARFAGMKWWQASGLFVRRRTARAWRKITAFAATPRTKPIPARAFATAEVRSERVAPRDVEFADTARS